MENVEDAENAVTNLNATELMGRTMNVEKARRGRARTRKFNISGRLSRNSFFAFFFSSPLATPGQYHGPPKRCSSEFIPSLVPSEFILTPSPCSKQTKEVRDLTSPVVTLRGALEEEDATMTATNLEVEDLVTTIVRTEETDLTELVTMTVNLEVVTLFLCVVTIGLLEMTGGGTMMTAGDTTIGTLAPTVIVVTKERFGGNRSILSLLLACFSLTLSSAFPSICAKQNLIRATVEFASERLHFSDLARIGAKLNLTDFERNFNLRLSILINRSGFQHSLAIHKSAWMARDGLTSMQL